MSEDEILSALAEGTGNESVSLMEKPVQDDKKMNYLFF
jgi:hypothetical protein